MKNYNSKCIVRIGRFVLLLTLEKKNKKKTSKGQAKGIL